MALSGAAHAQTPFPVKPIRILVPSSPGGALDTMTRIVSARLDGALGQPVIVDNRPGANGALAAELTAKAPPDGHTLMLSANALFVINPFIYKKLSYDPMKDFALVTTVASAGQVVVVHPALPVKSIQELITLARARPGQITYGTPGVGSGQHLAIALFQNAAKLALLHVPYKSGAQATIDLVSGQTQLGFASTRTAATFVEQGKLRALAFTAKGRSKVLPQLPTIAEAGLPGFEAQNWYGIVGPARTPNAVIARLNKEIVQILNLPDSQKRLESVGIDVWTGTPDEFAAYMKSEYDKWGRLIKELRIAD